MRVPGWSFLTGKKENIDQALYKLGQYVQDKNSHKTIVIIGNEATGLWKKAFGLAQRRRLDQARRRSDERSATRSSQKAPKMTFSDSPFSTLRLLCHLSQSWCIVPRVPQTAQPHTASERRGKEIYLRGPSPSGREITGRIGEIDVPASTVSCAGCHGLRGEGKTEGGVTAGNLTWPHLSKPYGHTHPTGRKHGPFNESSFIRAVVNGIDSDGNDLLVVMPRYKLSAEDMADLIAYVKRIDTDLDPGLTDTSIRIGLVLPSQGAFADVSAAMKDVFTAYFDNLNERGGIFSRKIDLRVADAGAGGANHGNRCANLRAPRADICVRRWLERGRRCSNCSARA